MYIALFPYAYKIKGRPANEARPSGCATKNGKKGSTQMTMAVYAAENDIEVESSVSGQHTRKTPDFFVKPAVNS